MPHDASVRRAPRIQDDPEAIEALKLLIRKGYSKKDVVDVYAKLRSLIAMENEA